MGESLSEDYMMKRDWQAQFASTVWTCVFVMAVACWGVNALADRLERENREAPQAFDSDYACPGLEYGEDDVEYGGGGLMADYTDEERLKIEEAAHQRAKELKRALRNSEFNGLD